MILRSMDLESVPYRIIHSLLCDIGKYLVHSDAK